MRITSSLRPERVGRGFERARDLLQGLGIGVVGAARRLADHAAGPDKPGDGIDMAVGMVVQESVVEPDDPARAERLAERRFGFRFGPGVAIVIEQGLAGGEDGAVAVMLDGAAFQHEIEFEGRRAGEQRDVVADRGVAGQVELAAPAIGPESQRNRRHARCGRRSGRYRGARYRHSAQERSRPRRRARLGPKPRLPGSPPAPARGWTGSARAPAPPRRGAGSPDRRSIRPDRPARRSIWPFAAPIRAGRTRPPW